MKYDAAKLYKSIDFLEAVEELINVQSYKRPSLFERENRRARREIRQIGESHKEFIRCTKYNSRRK